MSIELVDARIKITPETDAVVEAIHRASGRDRSEVLREVLHKWAAEYIHEASLIQRLLKSRGIQGNPGE